MPSTPVNSPSPVTASTSASAFSMGNVLFVLFKHKWLLLVSAALSLCGAAAYYLRTPPVHVSEAKLLVIYVLNRDPIKHVESTTPVGDGRGSDAIIKAEIDIIKSWDLAQKVVEKIGMERFREAGISGDNPAGVVVNGLTAKAEKGSSVIRVTFQHSDLELTKLVLDELIRQYFVKHHNIRSSFESLEIIRARVSESSTLIGNLDAELKKLKQGSDLPITQLTQKTDEALAKVKQELDAAKLAYAEQEAWLTEVERFMSGGGSPDKKSPALPVTPGGRSETANPGGNGAPANSPGNPTGSIVPLQNQPNKPTVPTRPARDNAIVAEYHSILNKIAILDANSMFLRNFNSESPQVKDHEKRLRTLRDGQWKLESMYPYLLETRGGTAGGPTAAPVVDLLAERGKLASAQARITVLEPHLSELLAKSAQLSKDAPVIAKKERDREIEQKNFDHLLGSQVIAESNSMVPSEKVPGVDVIQAPTPPFLDSNLRTTGAAGIAAGGFALGAVAVLVFGLLLNRTIKRPAELEEHLGVPLMMTIPFFSDKVRRKLTIPAASQAGSSGPSGALTIPWRSGNFIRPYAESIRDRLGIYFERNKVTHKPKLIGVTGFSFGAGVSTLAGGLAAALSEVGEGRVLLVDMNVANGKAINLTEGMPVLSLGNALKNDRGLQPYTDKLYLARVENSAPGVGSLLLKRLFENIQNLQNSDFDYIVFDLPPLGPTSPAAAMGGLLDTVVVMVEAEANSREEVKRGYRDLIGSGANVSTVFNKARAYGPMALVGSV